MHKRHKMSDRNELFMHNVYSYTTSNKNENKYQGMPIKSTWVQFGIDKCIIQGHSKPLPLS